MVGCIQSGKGQVVLPRFELRYDGRLEASLQQLGMIQAFNYTSADFTRLTSTPEVCVSKVKHKTFLEVNEEGTEAAGATAIELVIIGSVVPPTPPFHMIVDRPFFCAIRDNTTGVFLFMGAVLDPK